MSEEASLDEFTDESEASNDVANQPNDGLIKGVAWSTLDYVPDEWNVNNIGSDIDLLTGNNFSSKDFADEGGVPLIRIRDLGTDKTTLNFTGEYDSKYLIEADDLLVGMDGEFEPHLWSGPKSLLNQRVCKIEPTKQYNKIFLRYGIEKPLFYIQKSIAGTTVKHLSQSNIRDVNLPTPSLEEQRKIATILYAVDQTIQKTEEIIEQTKRVDDGLLQSLFSGERLDCDYDEVPTVGSIPDYWESGLMGEECTITMGSSPKSEYYNESGDGLPFFQANNEFGLRSPSHNRWCSNPVKTAEEGSTLMTIRGTYVGQVNMADRNCCIGRGLAAISAGDSILPEYLYHHLRRRERYVKSIAIGSTFDSVSSDDLDNLVIAIPPKEEQKEIAESLEEVQKTFMDSHEYISQLKRLKQGLMQDLLSGEVRTDDVDIEVLDDVLAHG
ncbi:restriction endonuclease subunit S [Halococcus salsus]|uniref:restriction endonuclease subunit S n=1 Tax=Halococcus salsus TaxID=2162894 RepID=UPI00135C3373|nr:restriction endonuclease subunit S [Halococcus salsus]